MIVRDVYSAAVIGAASFKGKCVLLLQRKKHAACIPAIRDHNFITVLSEHDFDTLDDVINAISLF